MQAIEDNIVSLLIIPFLGWFGHILFQNQKELVGINKSIEMLTNQMNALQVQMNLFVKTEIDEIKDLVRIAKGED